MTQSDTTCCDPTLNNLLEHPVAYCKSLYRLVNFANFNARIGNGNIFTKIRSKSDLGIVLRPLTLV